MDSLKEKLEEFNNEPVYYCKHCLSLKIMALDEFDYCDECGSSAIDSTHIENWKEIYRNRYNKDYLK